MSTFDWTPLPGTLMEIGVRQEANGDWLAVGRHKGTREVWGGSCNADRNEAIRTMRNLMKPAEEPTVAGAQYVIPGCEKDKSRGPAQLNLF